MAALGLGLVACSGGGVSSLGHGRDNPRALTDTTGAKFGFVCDDMGCKVTSIDGTPSPTNCGPGSTYIYFTEHFVRICAGVPISGGIAADYAACRPATCALPTDCPIFDGADYQCAAGLCQIEGIAFHRYDVEALCLADHPRAVTCAEATNDPEVMRVEGLLKAACASDAGPDPTCTIPPTCRQP